MCSKTHMYTHEICAYNIGFGKWCRATHEMALNAGILKFCTVETALYDLAAFTGNIKGKAKCQIHKTMPIKASAQQARANTL